MSNFSLGGFKREVIHSLNLFPKADNHFSLDTTRPPGYPKRDECEPLPDWVDVQAYLNLCCSHTSRKHTYIILTPLNPTLYSKLGFRGVYIILLISAQNIDCGYSLEPPRRVYVLIRNLKKNIRNLPEKFQFLEVKFSIYLHRRVFIMRSYCRVFGAPTHMFGISSVVAIILLLP